MKTNNRNVPPRISGALGVPGSPSIERLSRKTGSFGFQSHEYRDSSFRVRLYRFMAESIPLINSVLWTWTRLAAAPGGFSYISQGDEVDNLQADEVLTNLFHKISKENFGSFSNASEILVPFFNSLFLDGAVAGKLDFYSDLSGIYKMEFFDLSKCQVEISSTGEVRIRKFDGVKDTVSHGTNVFYYSHNPDIANPYGQSILHAVPFVTYIEQQLVDDMRRSMHNSGYHRLHIKITPPEKRENENDEKYVSRANSYFDDTLAMVRDIKTEDNPITWDDVSIEHIGPGIQGGSKSNNWYLTHRSMVEEICSGTNLAPFLLGYSYNATTNWAQFKYDLIMRQVHSVQYSAQAFLEWLANIELALKGFNLTAVWKFDNRFSALAQERVKIKKDESSLLIDLLNAGLIDKETAERKVRELL
ncbi:MAG: hypothetical protein KAR42_05425 [candidate division Zixibacteria bacterium]|nr:hypothetical protein [candidate division Zixibacteria bacterium]